MGRTPAFAEVTEVLGIKRATLGARLLAWLDERHSLGNQLDVEPTNDDERKLGALKVYREEVAVLATVSNREGGGSHDPRTDHAVAVHRAVSDTVSDDLVRDGEDGDLLPPRGTKPEVIPPRRVRNRAVSLEQKAGSRAFVCSPEHPCLLGLERNELAPTRVLREEEDELARRELAGQLEGIREVPLELRQVLADLEIVEADGDAFPILEVGLGRVVHGQEVRERRRMRLVARIHDHPLETVGDPARRELCAVDVLTRQRRHPADGNLERDGDPLGETLMDERPALRETVGEDVAEALDEVRVADHLERILPAGAVAREGNPAPPEETGAECPHPLFRHDDLETDAGQRCNRQTLDDGRHGPPPSVLKAENLRTLRLKLPSATTAYYIKKPQFCQELGVFWTFSSYFAFVSA